MKTLPLVLVSASTLALAGCWSPPNANVIPRAKPGLIQDSVQAETVLDGARVAAVDAGHSTITLALPDGTTCSYQAEPKVNLAPINAGDRVKARVTDSLTVFVLDNGQVPSGVTAETSGVSPRVLLVDPSYRELTLQSFAGPPQTYKAGLDARLQEMEPGDSVTRKPMQLTSIKITKYAPPPSAWPSNP